MVQIKDFAGRVLGEVDAAYLRGADLRGAYLRGAYLRGAYLRGADLRGAYLRGAYLRGADLRRADLRGADLGGADLRRAYLRRADLGGADLRGADLRGCKLPPPTAVLLARWGDVSDDLCADLMLFDASCHPDPGKFDEWARGGACPYADAKVERAACFQERTELWGKGRYCRPYDLMARLLAEKCPEWSGAEVAAFVAKRKKEGA